MLGVNFYLVITTVGSKPPPVVLAFVVIGGIFYSFVCLCMVWEDLARAVAAINRLLCARGLSIGVPEAAQQHRTAPLDFAAAGSAREPLGEITEIRRIS